MGRRIFKKIALKTNRCHLDGIYCARFYNRRDFIIAGIANFIVHLLLCLLLSSSLHQAPRTDQILIVLKKMPFPCLLLTFCAQFCKHFNIHICKNICVPWWFCTLFLCLSKCYIRILMSLSIREAIVQKIPEFYEIISQTGRGLIGFHISYSEIVNTPKSVAKSE